MTSLLTSTHIPLDCGHCVSPDVRLLLLFAVAACAAVYCSTAGQSRAGAPDPPFHLHIFPLPSEGHSVGPGHLTEQSTSCHPALCEIGVGVWSQSLCSGRTAQCDWSAGSVLAWHPHRYYVRPWHETPSGWQWDGTSQNSPCVHATMWNAAEWQWTHLLFTKKSRLTDLKIRLILWTELIIKQLLKKKKIKKKGWTIWKTTYSVIQCSSYILIAIKLAAHTKSKVPKHIK